MIVCNIRNLNNPVTGVQRYTQEILLRLPLEVDTITPSAPLNGIKGHLWEQCYLPLLIKNKLLWSPSNTGPLLVKNQVVTIHDLSPLDHPEWTKPKFSSWYQFLIPRLIQKAVAVLTVSEFTKSRINHYCPGAAIKTYVTQEGADARFYKRHAHEIDAITKNLALPSERYFLAVGSIEPRKNLSRLIDVWREAHEEIAEDIWLIFVGGVGQENIFAKSTYSHLPPRIHFTGRVDDQYLPALYSGAIATLYLSLYEGFGLPALEAMSCGSPLIFANQTALPEVVGAAGLGVHPDNNLEIGKAIKLISENKLLQEDLRNRGLNQSKKFSWDVAAHQVAAVLNEASHR